MSGKVKILIAVVAILFFISVGLATSLYIISHKSDSKAVSNKSSTKIKQDKVVDSVSKKDSQNDEFVDVDGKKVKQIGKDYYIAKLDVKGSEITVGMSSNVAIGVLNAEEFDSIGSGRFAAYPQGKFIATPVIIQNGQNDAITVNEASFKLIDKDNRVYSSSTDASMAWAMETQQHFLTKINPGNSSIFVFFFDVPKNSDVRDFEMLARGGITGREIKIPFNYIEKASIR